MWSLYVQAPILVFFAPPLFAHLKKSKSRNRFFKNLLSRPNSILPKIALYAEAERTHTDNSMRIGKNLVPTYEEVATNLKGLAIVAKIDATVEEGLAHRYGIRGFPTLKLFKPGSKGKDLQDYQGARSAAALVSFVTSALSGSNILRLKSTNHESLWTQAPTSVPRVILFSAKAEPSTLYKSLSMRFSNQLVFAQIAQSDPLTAQYGVDSFPSVLVFTEQGADAVKFDGKLSAEALTQFLTPFAGADSSAEKDAKTETKPSTSTPPPAPKPAAAWQSAEDFDSLNEIASGRWVVALLNQARSDLQKVKDNMLLHYGKDGKFQFVEVSGHTDVSKKFGVDQADSAHWIIYNSKRSKFAHSAFTEDQIPSALMDRILSGDIKLTSL